jgi:hypothetical protein
MTPEQKARLFGQLFGLMDSDQSGERVAALDKLLGLRAKMGWPTFVDLLRKLESIVTPEQLEAAEKDRAQWQRAHDTRVQENAALARRNAVLSAAVMTLRSALWASVNGWLVTGVVVLAVFAYGGWRWSNAEAAPDTQPVANATDSAQAAVDAGLRDVLSRTKWGQAETPPVIARVSGVDYWIVVRGTTDAKSHTDQWGRPIERHCLALHASEAGLCG